MTSVNNHQFIAFKRLIEFSFSFAESVKLS